jgi:uncharacterized small protein (DUF1192 family)
MAELKFDNLSLHTVEELKTAQKVLSKELRRKKAEEKEAETLHKLAAKHGYKLTKDTRKPEEKKTEEKLTEVKPAAAAPFKSREV